MFGDPFDTFAAPYTVSTGKVRRREGEGGGRKYDFPGTGSFTLE